MGRGNVCVTGPYEGLFYIDSDDYDVYRFDDPLTDYPETCLKRDLDYGELTGGGWLYDEEGSSNEYDDILDCFVEDFTLLFPSFKRCGDNTWLKTGAYGHYERKALLENGLFYIALEDNEWSMAVELIQKEEPWGQNWMENLQKRQHQRYLDGMLKCLLNRLPSVGTRSGAWTSGRITREEVIANEG